MLSIRKIGVLSRTYRHLNRYRQILAVFFKHGFGDLIERLNIDQYIEVGLQLISGHRRHRHEKHSRAARVRLAMEELGPTYIKFGQILSTRPDLVPVEFIKELTKLQDMVAPEPFEAIHPVLSRSLGAPHEEIFSEFDPTPMASASIGQVYRARLREGDRVAVKVQRPGIRRTIEIDLEIMLHLATLMEKNVEEMALHQPVRIVEEFARTIEKEIDYTIEAASMERMARQFLGEPTIYIPKVFREFTSARVLTMEYIDGIKVSEVDRLNTAGLDRKRITERGADFVLSQVFNHGFFHADPHPGNIFVLPGNVICLLDFGMTGTIARHMREDFVELVDAVVHHHEARATQVLLNLTSWEKEPDLRHLEKDVADFMGTHLFKPLKELEIGKVLAQMLELATKYRLRMPPDIFLMLKALTTVEGVARTLDPDFDMVTRTAPFIKRVKLERLQPQRIAGDLIRGGSELIHFAQQFPRDLREIARLIRNERLSVRVEDKGMETMLSTYDQISNRIAFSVIIAALLVGSALIVIANTPPLFYGISIIGLIGFLFAAIMGIWLLFAILRKGRL